MQHTKLIRVLVLILAITSKLPAETPNSATIAATLREYIALAQNNPELNLPPLNVITRSDGSVSLSITLDDGVITTAKLADGAVTNDKLADESITMNKLAFELAAGVASDATSTPNTVVGRNSSGSFAAHNITLSDSYGTLSLTGTGDVIKLGGNPFIHARSSNTDNSNTFVGINAGSANLYSNNGTANTGVGSSALNALTTGKQNIAVGNNALAKTTVGRGNVGIGNYAATQNTTGADNVAIGYNTLSSNTTGSSNVAIGPRCLAALTGASYANISIGGFAGKVLATGSNNILLGYNAAGALTTGSANIVIGANALVSATDSIDQIAIGAQALNQCTATASNIAIGRQALSSNTTGVYNHAVGDLACQKNTTGIYNVAFGSNSLRQNTTSSANTAIGHGALAMATASNNTALGYATLANNTTGENNLALGHSAGLHQTTGSNNIYIGHQGAGTESKTIRLGTTGTYTCCFIAGINGRTVTGGTTVYINNQGQLGTVVSARSVKDDITPINIATINKFLNLEPVAFTYTKELDPTHEQQYGLIADDVAQQFPELALCDNNGIPTTVRYNLLVPLALAALKQQRSKIQVLDTRVMALEAALASLIKN